MSTNADVTMTKLQPRIGHAQIGKIIEDMEALLPSESIDRADYRGCRTTYGLLSTTYKRANDSNDPTKEYRELKELEKELRKRLTDLDPRGLPRKFQDPLDDLKTGIDNALRDGVGIDFIIRGLRDILEEKPDATPAPKEAPNKMVSEKRFKKVWDDWKLEQEKNRKLNEENNRLTLELKRYQMRDRSNGEPPEKRRRL
jgi:hypothetical protein